MKERERGRGGGRKNSNLAETPKLKFSLHSFMTFSEIFVKSLSFWNGYDFLK
jgi:hypothetical protein